MSSAPDEQPSFQRPRWIVPAAVIGAVLLLIGIVLALDWTGGGGDQPVRITTSAVVTTTTGR